MGVAQCAWIDCIEPCTLGCACKFLLVVTFQISIGGRIRPQRIFVFLFFQRSAKRLYSVTPTLSVQVTRPPEHPPHRDLGLLVGCCIVCSNGGHLKAETPPLSLFFKGLRFGTPNKNPTMVRAQPTPRALYGPIGSSGAKIWVHGGCCHGERGPKPLKGRPAADHVGCCVFCVLCCGRKLLLGVSCMNTHKKDELCRKK